MCWCASFGVIRGAHQSLPTRNVYLINILDRIITWRYNLRILYSRLTFNLAYNSDRVLRIQMQCDATRQWYNKHVKHTYTPWKTSSLAIDTFSRWVWIHSRTFSNYSIGDGVIFYTHIRRPESWHAECSIAFLVWVKNRMITIIWYRYQKMPATAFFSYYGCF